MARPIHVVLDTCILVAALRSKRGAANALLTELGLGNFETSVSVTLAVEYESVLKRPGLIPDYSQEELDLFIESFLRISNHIEVRFKHRPCLPDPKDDMVLEVAVNAYCDGIVTNNIKDLKLASRFGLKVWTASEFLHAVRSFEP